MAEKQNILNQFQINDLQHSLDEGDLGLIKIYHKKFGKLLVSIREETNSYYLYNSLTNLWEPKTKIDILKHFMENMRSIYQHLVEHYKKKAEDTQNNKEAKEFNRRANHLQHFPKFTKVSKAKPLMDLISSQFYNKNFLNNLNNNKELLPVKNGVIQLKDGKLRKRVKEDYFSFKINVEFKGLEYETKTIDKFMLDIFLNNSPMVEYIQKVLGYSITGFVNQHKIFLWYGSGGNGKGVLMNLLKNLMKPCYRQLSSDIIIEAGKESTSAASPNLMQLLGARLGFVDESEIDRKMNKAMVKNITGSSTIVARPLYGNAIVFEQTCQLFILINSIPKINFGPSLENRLVLIPFLAQFQNPDKIDQENVYHKLADSHIEKKLNEKLDEFLVWLVNGSVKYFKDGVIGQPPPHY